MATDRTRRRGLVRRCALVLAAALIGVGVAVPAPPAQAALTGELMFTGHGWGHGRGLGQWGSYGYAVNSGWDFSRILSHFYGGTTQGQQGNPAITVTLTGQDGKDLVVTSGRDFTVGGVPVSAGSAARVQARPDGSFVLSTSLGCASPTVWTTPIPNSQVLPTVEPGTDLRAMLSLCTLTGTKQYRGEFSAVWVANAQRTVNRVLMEDYLRGVVPRESPASWGDAGGGKGIEALKAQSVAARSYAMAEGRSAWAKTCDTTACQVYLGAGTDYVALEDRRTDAAIAGTAGVVLRNSAGAVVRAEFSSSTGGYSAGGAFPAVRDDGDVASPYHNWSQSVPVATVGSAFGVGALLDIKVTARNGLGADGGRVTSVSVVGSEKTVSVTGAAVRTALGLRSDWFSIAPGQVAPPTGPPPGTPPARVQPALFLAGPETTVVPFGDPRDVPLVCDWNGDGMDTAGVFRGGTFHLSDGTSGIADVSLAFGDGGDQPVCGDWDGDGRDTVGIYRGGIVYLRNSLTSGVADRQFFFGAPGDTLVAGDWNGDSLASVGVWRSGLFLLTQSTTAPSTDVVVAYGGPGDRPVIGDWDGNRSDTLGVHRGNSFYLRNSTTSGVAERTVVFGDSSDAPVAGSWSPGAKDTIGITRGY